MPIGNVAPGLWLDVMVAEQLSLAVGAVQFTTAVHEVASVVWAIFVGIPEITGPWLSVMVTVKDDVAVFPAASVAV